MDLHIYVPEDNHRARRHLILGPLERDQFGRTGSVAALCGRMVSGDFTGVGWNPERKLAGRIYCKQCERARARREHNEAPAAPTGSAAPAAATKLPEDWASGAPTEEGYYWVAFEGNFELLMVVRFSDFMSDRKATYVYLKEPIKPPVVRL